MTYDHAVQKAKKVSRETGCVQHVNQLSNLFNETGVLWYSVSDWYDYVDTVISFVNGEEVQ